MLDGRYIFKYFIFKQTFVIYASWDAIYQVTVTAPHQVEALVAWFWFLCLHPQTSIWMAMQPTTVSLLTWQSPGLSFPWGSDYAWVCAHCTFASTVFYILIYYSVFIKLHTHYNFRIRSHSYLLHNSLILSCTYY